MSVFCPRALRLWSLSTGNQTTTFLGFGQLLLQQRHTAAAETEDSLVLYQWYLAGGTILDYWRPTLKYVAQNESFIFPRFHLTSHFAHWTPSNPTGLIWCSSAGGAGWGMFSAHGHRPCFDAVTVGYWPFVPLLAPVISRLLLTAGRLLDASAGNHQQKNVILCCRLDRFCVKQW